MLLIASQWWKKENHNSIIIIQVDNYCKIFRRNKQQEFFEILKAWLGLKCSAFTCDELQVTLSDPI